MFHLLARKLDLAALILPMHGITCLGLPEARAPPLDQRQQPLFSDIFASQLCDAQMTLYAGDTRERQFPAEAASSPKDRACSSARKSNGRHSSPRLAIPIARAAPSASSDAR